jgi:hypothetical protein
VIRVVQAKDPETVCIWLTRPNWPVDVELVLEPEVAEQFGADVIVAAVRASAAKRRKKQTPEQ